MATPEPVASGLQANLPTSGNTDTDKQAAPSTAPTIEVAPSVITGQSPENVPSLPPTTNIVPTTDTAPTVVTGQDKEKAPPIPSTPAEKIANPAPTVTTSQDKEKTLQIPATPAEKTANPAPETSKTPAKPIPEIPKSRPISKDQIGLKILYPPEDIKKAPKIEVE